MIFLFFPINISYSCSIVSVWLRSSLIVKCRHQPRHQVFVLYFCRQNCKLGFLFNLTGAFWFGAMFLKVFLCQIDFAKVWHKIHWLYVKVCQTQRFLLFFKFYQMGATVWVSADDVSSFSFAWLISRRLAKCSFLK